MWLKREIARSVLQRDLPLSAIYEAERASEALEGWMEPPEAVPTDPSAHSYAHQQEVRTPAHPSLANGMPQETGSAHKQSHLHGHGHRKWHY